MCVPYTQRASHPFQSHRNGEKGLLILYSRHALYFFHSPLFHFLHVGKEGFGRLLLLLLPFELLRLLPSLS